MVAIFPVAYLASSLILDSTIDVCPFRAAFGRPCIFCGLTRAFAHATHGNFAEAFALNPLWAVAMLLVGAAALSSIAAAVVPRPRMVSVDWWKSPPWLVVGFVVVGSLVRALLT